jgi:seryl-tRNA synthetase
MGEEGSNRSIVKNLKNEWALFWESIAGEGQTGDAFETGKLEVLNREQLNDIIKALSQDRKRLNQKLESLHKEIELNSAKLESIRLVGGRDEEILKRINELSDIGQVLSEQLNKLDEKIKWTRNRQENFLTE